MEDEMSAEDKGSKPSKPWYKKKRIVIPIAVIILAIAAGSGGSDSTSENTQTDVAKEETATEAVAVIGTEVRDGKFAFKVTNVKCGISKVGTSTFGTKAQGQYCAVTMQVGNIGDEPQTFFSSNQKAFDSQGREFSNDTTAELYATDAQVWLKEINPGNALEGTVYFDIPKDATIDYLELHDSAFSGGVKVYNK
jgi:hypothetical protein